MKFALGSGITWGLDTVILGIAMILFTTGHGGNVGLAFAGLHDLVAALILLGYMGVRGRLKDTWAAVKTRSGKAVMGAALLGGPVGMSGYVIAIDNIGPGYTAIISTLYPAVGTFLAFVFLKERMKPGQIIALLVALAGIIVMGFSSMTAEVPGVAWLGVAGALMCVVGWGSEAVILSWGMRDDLVDNETALQIRETTSAIVYAVVVLPLFGVFGLALEALPTMSMAVLAIAAAAGVLSYLLYYKAINVIGASRAMALNVSYSAWAVLFSAGAFLINPTWGAVPTWLQIVCCVVIVVATVLAASPNWKELRHFFKNDEAAQQKEAQATAS